MATQVLTTTFDISELKTMITEAVAEVITKLRVEPEVSTNTEKRILTREETAAMLNISLPTLHDYTKKGIIKGNRFGTLVRYRIEDIDNALVAMKSGLYRKD